MIRAVAVDESLFDSALVENYRAFRAWLQYFLAHVIHSRIILVPQGRKESWISALNRASHSCLPHPLQDQLAHFLPERTKEIPVAEEWKAAVRQSCQVEGAILDTLALAACEHVDAVVMRNRPGQDCTTLPRKTREKIVPWNEYPGKKRFSWETEGIGGRSVDTTAASDEIFSRMLRWSPSASVCDPYVNVALLEHVLCGFGRWDEFKTTILHVVEQWCPARAPNQRYLTVKSVAMRPRDRDKCQEQLLPGMGIELQRVYGHPQEQAKMLYQHLATSIPTTELCVEVFDGNMSETHDRFLLTGNWALQLSRGFDFQSATRYREWFASMMPLDLDVKAAPWTAVTNARWPL